MRDRFSGLFGEGETGSPRRRFLAFLVTLETAASGRGKQPFCVSCEGLTLTATCPSTAGHCSSPGDGERLLGVPFTGSFASRFFVGENGLDEETNDECMAGILDGILVPARDVDGLGDGVLGGTFFKLLDADSSFVIFLCSLYFAARML